MLYEHLKDFYEDTELSRRLTILLGGRGGGDEWGRFPFWVPHLA